jgi:predicted RNase H-like HicB family nuclease
VVNISQADRDMGRVAMIEIDREEDGRWIGEVPSLPGVMAYGETQEEARKNVLALAFHVIGDRVAHGEAVPSGAKDLFAYT